MRGRGNNNNSNNNNNRRGPNPLTRNYESNGPDVKIRGSAQQIAEKYTNLARDAQSAGDRVIAENYLQHAEHYNRIIAAAQAQMPQQQNRDQRDFGDDADDDRDVRDDRDENGMPSSSDNQHSDNQGTSADDGSGPQPVIEGVPVEVQQEVMSREDSQQRQVSNGHGAQAEADGDAPRRPRRPRRSRSRNEQDSGDDAQPEAIEGEKSEITASAAE